MRSEPNLLIERFRVTDPRFASDPGGAWGAFKFGELFIISSGSGHPSGAGWEHVSVSSSHRTPTWAEMKAVKELFWRDDETVVQFHPPLAQNINLHPHCLHLWKRVGADYELPPAMLIGPTGTPRKEQP